ncbi:putative patatin/cPLA2 family phospholipase [Maribacter vaceletii]|uniref:Putative patatin/cPLA2 family phospholipase n=1 Tax=Maribacter vaceletii TaxID=1206816 RepID=A0A495E8E7_9FLAO|nr:patatin-like phospholipase family protein [Maribacter vaceletii]RKR13200.1 putative patatin/cPLA2 family phospholipase [Maribacter vaceletii]
MRALVISGGGSKGAFAGGVSQYLMQKLHYNYELFLGTSTGSLLISHLALGEIDKIKNVYTSVSQDDIFSNCPFVIQNKYGVNTIGINHWNVFKNFYRGSKTFGESHNLLKLIKKTITKEEFEELKSGPKEVVVTVSNLSHNTVEYKSVNDYSYDDFCEWVWISCNYTPFMSLARKNGCEYADGGLANMVPIEEAIKRGATEIDVIVLQTEVSHLNRMPSKNSFSLLTNMFEFMLDRIEHQNIRIGKYVANHNNTIINFYYTPTVLTTNSLIFNEEKMSAWWESGYNFAKFKNIETSQIKIE